MELIKSVKNAGVIGAGGAGFPTHVKLDASAEYLIINGAECEPLLRVDQQLFTEFTQQIIQGIQLVMETTNSQKAFIGIKKKHKEAIEKLKAMIGGTNIELILLDDFYPAGDEQVLVYEAVGRIVPEVSIPLKVGCIVINVETVLNALKSTYGEPVTDTWMTITGKVPTPVTISVPVGSIIEDILKHYGVPNTSNYAVIDGGPMMGKIIQNLADPVTKTSKGLIVLPSDHVLIQKKSMPLERARKIARVACEQCRMCTDLCPRFLLGHNMQPHKMMRKVSYQYENLEDAEIAQLCCECNLCELYACPVNITPKSINVLYKRKLEEQKIRYTSNKTEFTVAPTREYRKVPVKRLIAKLDLEPYNVEAPITESTYIPNLVKIPLKQHTGLPAVPTVTIGQRVNRGDLIGEIPENSLGARIHASINGRITAIDQYITIVREEDGRSC